MLLPAKEFFDNLPSKQCSKCGCTMEEQTECYETVCDDCQGESMFNPSVFDLSAR